MKKRIGLFVKNDAEAAARADELEIFLRESGAETIRAETFINDEAQPGYGAPSTHIETAPDDLFCVFVLGGDGTFLSAVRWIGENNIPILGAKFGEVGFLAETTDENLFASASKVLKGEFTTELRTRLLVTGMRDGKKLTEGAVLNDLVINRGALARLASIKTYIDDYYLTTYRADGLIVATPTGSTAYSLAAGGPVIHPAVEGIVMTPICPFTLTNRPLIVPDSVNIKIEFEEGSSDIMATLDGQSGFSVTDRDVLYIRKSPHPVCMIQIFEQCYFDLLKAKLRWSGGRI